MQAWLTTPSALAHLFSQSLRGLQVFAEPVWAQWLWRERFCIQLMSFWENI